VANDFYRLSLSERRRMLADLGFVRDDDRIWRHADGRAIGEGVVGALIDPALLRYLGVDPPTAPGRTSTKNSRRRRNSKQV
jgi:hypothetical protein